MKILKLKNAVTEIKILTYGFNIRLDKEKEMSINCSSSHMERKKKREGTENGFYNNVYNRLIHNSQDLGASECLFVGWREET